MAGAMLLVSAIDAWPAALVAFGLSFVATLWARLPLPTTGRAVAGVMLPVLPWFVLLPTFDRGNGAEEAALWLLRLGAIACLGAVLIHSTGIPRLLEAASALPLPGLLVRIALFAYRFAFVLTTELRRTRIALHCRGFRMKTNAHTFGTLGAVVGGAIVRSEARAERVAQAMNCRGFRGSLPRLSPFNTRTRDVALAALFAFPAAGLACSTFVGSWRYS